MIKLDRDWMRKVQNAVDKQERASCKYRDNIRCNKSVLVDRYFSFLNNRCFKLKITKELGYEYETNERLFNEEVFYAYFAVSQHTMTNGKTNKESSWYNYGVEFSLGYSSNKYIINFRDEKFDWREFKLTWNELLQLEYEEITSVQYMDFVKKFIL